MSLCPKQSPKSEQQKLILSKALWCLKAIFELDAQLLAIVGYLFTKKGPKNKIQRG